MKWFLVFFLLFLSGCSGLPRTMQGGGFANINLLTVKANIPAHQNKAFRWGGSIINVVNEENSSQIQVLYYPIGSYGRPLTEKKTEGRFAISSPLFLDPAIYKEGAEITVTGILSGEIKQQIGKKTLTLPLLNIQNIHIWPEYQEQNDRAYFYPYPSPYFPYYRYNSYYNYYY